MSPCDAPISVLIPCRDCAATLGEAIDSALQQTARPLEILVIDDHSSDRSVEIARQFGPPVRVLQSSGHGPAAARNLGVREARGEFIAFVDADDTIDARKCEMQLAVLERTDPHTVVHTGARLWWPDGSRPAYQRSGGEQAVGRDCTRTIFERNPVCGASVMMHRSLLLELGNYDPDIPVSEDYLLWLIASTCCEFIYLPEPLYHIRRHARSVTHRTSYMAYYHWRAQDAFRQRCPRAFASLGTECVTRSMVEPVLRAVREAYWVRDGRDYLPLLRLARQLAPEDPFIRKLWRRRHLPWSLLRCLDHAKQAIQPSRAEVVR